MFLTVAQVAAQIGASEKTVRRMVDSGELPSRRFRRRVRVPATALEAPIDLAFIHI